MTPIKSTSQIKVPKKISEQVVGQSVALELIEKAAKQRRNIFLVGDPGTGKCVGGDTWIVTPQGPIKARELYTILRESSTIIEKGDEEYILPKPISTLTLDKDYKISESRIVRGYKGLNKKGFKIITRSGSEFIVSGDHPVSILKDNKVDFCAADELKEGLFIATARNIPSQNSGSVIPHILEVSNEFSENEGYIAHKGRNGIVSPKIKSPKLLNPELSYFIGVCIAEARWQGNFLISNTNKRLKNYLVEVLLDVFDYPAKNIIESDEGLFLKESGTLAHYLNSIFNYPLDRKKQSWNKIIPKIFYSTNINNTRAFIAGLIDGDGHKGDWGFRDHFI